ncbi:MAG: NAD-dependent epimerase/dehydratase family protein [Saprospiraceae bacterium]|jgi:nucleoside-diphosphate-sugar epimerase|nr:NAD-dependent epimerase/dehydratase family protein [Saprospiraceae bacterium]
MHTILGINGAIGPHLAAALRRRNLSVRGVSRRSFAGNDWTHMPGDVTNPADVLAAVDGSEVVYLLVGIEYKTAVWRRTWPIIMENVIAACRAHGSKLVFMDNVYPYGLVEGPMIEDTPMRPCSEKGKIRMATDRMLLDAMDKGLRACIARGADFYGPNCSTSVLNATVIERYAAGKSAFLMGRADKVHTYSYVPDLGPALAILGTDARADGQVWHLPTSRQPWTGADWAKAAAAAFGVPPKYQTTSTLMLRLIGLFNPLMREMAEMNYQFTHDYVLSSEKFERTFGLKPTPNEQGLAETVAFYKK